MMLRRYARQSLTPSLIALILASSALAQQPVTTPPRRDDARVARLKQDAIREVDAQQKKIQEMVDMIFSFGELGYQEFETSKYLTGILRQNGFTVTEGIAGMPTAWVAKWGSGKPVISLGSDIDGIPQASQKPGVAYRDPLVDGAPGHGEGHNSGQAVNIAAALAVKKIMEREKISGTLVLWPGVAEELVGAKAYFVREGLFKDVDAVIFTHVSQNLSTAWGTSTGSGLVSLEFTFEGQTAHSAGKPWMGRSALDAVELFNAGWNYRREHLRPQSRIHYVIRDGGDQPNVVPRRASVWYYLRETDYAHIRELMTIADSMARGAAHDRDHLHRLAHARHRVASAFQQADRRSDDGECKGGRHAEVEYRRPDAREGAPDGDRREGEGTRHRPEGARGSNPGRGSARWRLRRHW